MLYPIILLKNSQLDDLLISSKPIEAKKIIFFLGEIKECAENNFRNPHEFEGACIIFRKWKTLLLELHDEFYAQMIDTAPEQQKDNYLELVPPTEFQKKIDGEIIQIDTKTKEQLKIFSNFLIPTYSTKTFEEELEKTNNNFFEHYPETRSILNAEKSFKLGKLEVAYSTLKKISKNFLQKDSLDNISRLLYSWALHILGNIAYAYHDHESANEQYKASLRLKEAIDGLPKSLLYVTKMKVVSTNLATYNNRSDSKKRWQNELEVYYDEFKNDKDELLIENKDIVRVLETAFVLYFGKSCVYLEEYEKAISYLDFGIEKSKEQKNIINEFRGRLLRVALGGENFGGDLANLKSILIKFSDKEKNNPYVRRSANSQNLIEIGLLNPILRKNIDTLFKECGIMPFVEFHTENLKSA